MGSVHRTSLSDVRSDLRAICQDGPFWMHGLLLDLQGAAGSPVPPGSRAHLPSGEGSGANRRKAEDTSGDREAQGGTIPVLPSRGVLGNGPPARSDSVSDGKDGIPVCV